MPKCSIPLKSRVYTSVVLQNGREISRHQFASLARAKSLTAKNVKAKKAHSAILFMGQASNPLKCTVAEYRVRGHMAPRNDNKPHDAAFLRQYAPKKSGWKSL